VGCIPTAISLGVIIVILGLVVEAIFPLRTFDFLPFRTKLPLGFIGTIILFILLGLTIGVMWLLVWLLGKLPSFRNPTLRLAIRGLTLHRGRTAFSLLALIVGMTALSGTLIMARSINTLLYTSVSEPVGGNVVVMPLLPFSDTLVRSRL